jgi:hypothetical protein
MMKKLFLYVIPILVVIIALIVGHAHWYPERWNENFEGKARKDAWLLLGVPDIDYSIKGFDGWHRDAVIGAWVLTIRYDAGETITSVKRKFAWGFDYLDWADDYKKIWEMSLKPQDPLKSGK